MAQLPARVLTGATTASRWLDGYPHDDEGAPYCDVTLTDPRTAMAKVVPWQHLRWSERQAFGAMVGMTVDTSWKKAEYRDHMAAHLTGYDIGHLWEGATYTPADAVTDIPAPAPVTNTPDTPATDTMKGDMTSTDSTTDTPAPLTGADALIHSIASDAARKVAADVVTDALADYTPATIDYDAISDMVDKATAALRPYDIHIADRPTITVTDKVHEAFPKVLTAIGAGVNVFLTGPAGTGKSHLAKSVADALGLDFYSLACGPETSQVEVLGYNDANGRYVGTEFRRAFQGGGVMLIDEIDAADPGVLTATNAALANGHHAFPDGTVERHPDFIVIATGNTWGTGANAEYIGRNTLDAATLDRFVAFPIGYDRTLETSLVTPFLEDGATTFLAGVWKMRDNADTHSVRCVISTRGMLDAARLIRAGMSTTDAIDARILKGMRDGERSKVMAGVTL